MHNTINIIGTEIVNNYILVIIGVLLMFALYKVYQNPTEKGGVKKRNEQTRAIFYTI